MTRGVQRTQDGASYQGLCSEKQSSFVLRIASVSPLLRAFGKAQKQNKTHQKTHRPGCSHVCLKREPLTRASTLPSRTACDANSGNRAKG